MELHGNALKKEGETDERRFAVVAWRDAQGLSALLVAITSVNVWNRLNAATRRVAGARSP